MDMSENAVFKPACDKLEARTATIGVIGLGYVGLPLAVACARAGYTVVGFDTDASKPAKLNDGLSYIDAVSSHDIKRHIADGKFVATVDFHRLNECDVVVICVPTPLSRQMDPDLSYVRITAETIAGEMRPGQLIVLESTTYPGTTVEVLKPRLERSGLRAGEEFWIGFSPEREDPGNQSFSTSTIPKVIAGEGPQASHLMKLFYGAVVDRIVPVSSPSVAEAVKITENVFRAVNIALVNELKVIYEHMGIDVWEVIDAAATKPFGYMPFYPGPGLGGHCIPIDPFYLSWKAREFGLPARFIELAGEINVRMPGHVISRLADALDQHAKLSLSASSILIIGMAYKKNVSDIRESPSMVLLERLEERGAKVDFHDPHVKEIPDTRDHAKLAGRTSVELSAATVSRYDAVLIATDHDGVDYRLLADEARMIVDSRNVMARNGLQPKVLVKA